MKPLQLFAVILAMTGLLACQSDPPRTSTAEDRAELFDYIILKTIERESISEPKTRVMNYDPLKDMLKFRDEMIAADTDEALLHVLMKMSNVRRDRHAVVNTVEGGLKVNEDVRRTAPLVFQTDYAEPGNYFFFVGDFAKNILDYTDGTSPEIGDKLLAFNNVPIDEYVEKLRLYHRYSSYNGLWRLMAESLPQQHFRLPVPLDKENVSFTLERRNGEVYTLTLPYLEADDIDWEGYYKLHGDHRYSGFHQTISTISYDLYEHPRLPVLIIDWYGFRPSLIEDVDSLISYAQSNRLLGHDVIFDGTRARGGSNGAYLIRRLFSDPFHVTYGNLKISDLTPIFIEEKIKEFEAGELGGTTDGGKWQIEWLTTDVAEAYEKGLNFSNNVPHKLAHLPKDSDGILQPAPVRFTGTTVSLLGPYGGSHLDQYASMVIDNKLGYTIGMPVGGFSSTWEFGETLHFPVSGKPVAYFEWGMGHTLRPNVDYPLQVVDMYGRYYGDAMDPDGLVLEGNPPPVDRLILQTRDNYTSYYDILLGEALRYLGHRQ